MATLKISDLSVGDWVEYRDREWQVCSLYQFTEEVGLFRKDSQICESIEDIEPIPITAEILEKNGFVDKVSCLFRYEREWRGDKSAVNICSFDEELWFADFEFRDGRTCMSNIPIFYVNQLQHILRLIGVDKELNL